MQTDEILEDIDFMERPGTGDPTNGWAWGLAGAALGLGVLYLTHPRHGERRRENCRKFGRDCQTGLIARAGEWVDRWRGTDFKAEVRAHAPPYLQ